MKREHIFDGELPSGYEKLEYIVCGTNGPTYFQADNTVGTITRIVCEFVLTKYNSGQDTHILAGRQGSGNGYKYYVSINKNNCFQIENTNGGASTAVTSEVCGTGVPYVVDCTNKSGQQVLKVNDNVIYSGTKTGSQTFKPYLFAFYAAGNTNQFDYFNGKCYGVDLYNSDNEIIECYVPARRTADGKIGMFETITGTFKPSVNGEFLYN